MKRTAFYNIHKSLGAKMTDFAGYEMPVHYESIISEHMAVRDSVGVFDVSHMGEFIIRGPDALDFIQKCTTNDVAKLFPGKVQYSAMCYYDGGIVDDLLVYRFNDYYMLVVNASNIEKDFKWLSENITGFEVEIENKSNEFSLLAVQGINSLPVLQKVTDVDLSSMKYYTFTEGTIAGERAIISRTGYTGEKVGFELYFSSYVDISEKIWGEIFKAGEEYSIKPAGLGARDTLRLEAGYCLYGNDIDSTTNTIEAGLSWITKPDKGEFNGREKIISELNSVAGRRLTGLLIEGRIPARKGYEICFNGSVVGHITSGGYSPVLEKNIALGYVPLSYSEAGNELYIKIRNNNIKAKTVKLPFLKKV